MKDGFIGRLSLAISLGMRHGREASLAAQVVEVVHELASVKLTTIVEDYGARVMMLRYMNLRTSAVVVDAMASASIHLVK